MSLTEILKCIISNRFLLIHPNVKILLHLVFISTELSWIDFCYFIGVVFFDLGQKSKLFEVCALTQTKWFWIYELFFTFSFPTIINSLSFFIFLVIFKTRGEDFCLGHRGLFRWTNLTLHWIKVRIRCIRWILRWRDPSLHFFRKSLLLNDIFVFNKCNLFLLCFLSWSGIINGKIKLHCVKIVW